MGPERIGAGGAERQLRAAGGVESAPRGWPKRIVTQYSRGDVQIKHSGLRALHERGDGSRLSTDLVSRLRRIPATA